MLMTQHHMQLQLKQAAALRRAVMACRAAPHRHGQGKPGCL